jgi:hypothetical protein
MIHAGNARNQYGSHGGRALRSSEGSRSIRAEDQTAAQATADDNARFDKLEIKVDTGLTEVRAQITMLKWINGIVIDQQVVDRDVPREKAPIVQLRPKRMAAGSPGSRDRDSPDLMKVKSVSIECGVTE